MNTAAFPKILHLGDKQISTLFDGEVEITEKVDGSQLGFGKVDGELFVRSKDIGPLIKEIKRDVTEEEKENIKDQLWNIYNDQFLRAATDGFPQFYKSQLALGKINASS